MGNPDLTDGFAPLERPLAELIRAGDVDALAGFRVAHVDKVRRYCAQVCAPELIEDATDAAFVDLVGRLKATESPNADLEDLLLRATRGAAAGRFLLKGPPPRRFQRRADPATCAAMPELLAARANEELPGVADPVTRHVESCPTCTASAARMQLAERAFSGS